jgi:tetratricopeptide (TPR) repeat protein
MTFSNAMIVFMILTVFGLQSCSSTSEKSINNQVVNQDLEIKTIGNNIIELGDIPKSQSGNGRESLALSEQTVTTESKVVAVSTQEQAQYQTFRTQQTLIKSHLPENIHMLYRSALTEMKNKHWKKGIELLDEVIELHPNLSGAYLNKALAFYQLKQLNNAIEVLNSGLKVNAINPYIYNLKGIIAREQGLFIEAEEHYQKALTIWPNYSEAHLNVAVLYELYRGEFIKAQYHYQTYLLLEPKNSKVKQWLAGLEIKLAVKNRG